MQYVSHSVIFMVVFFEAHARLSNKIIEGVADDDTQTQYVTPEYPERSDSYNTVENVENGVGNSNQDTDNLPADDAEEPPLDYPSYLSIPKTGFSCQDKVPWKYYADVEAGCQLFHICEAAYFKVSFLCPVGSVFNQRYLVCDWWYNFDCSRAPEFYELNIDSSEAPSEGPLTIEEGAGNGADLSVALTGDGNFAAGPANTSQTGTQTYRNEDNNGNYRQRQNSLE